MSLALDQQSRRHLDALVDGLSGSHKPRVVTITGAGISLASGIPTFRGMDPDAIWKHDVTELGTYRYFQADPVGSWRWYLERFDRVLHKSSNPAHYALAALERWHTTAGGEFLTVTQNVDTLHEKAGAQTLIKVHGSAERVRCARVGCEHGAPHGSLARSDFPMEAFHANPVEGNLPRCPSCGTFLRQHVLWFDEFYDGHEDYEWPRVLHGATAMDMALFVGTSFSVGVTELFLHAGLQSRIPMYSLDPGATDPPHPDLRLLRGKSELILPELCRRLGVDAEGLTDSDRIP